MLATFAVTVALLAGHGHARLAGCHGTEVRPAHASSQPRPALSASSEQAAAQQALQAQLRSIESAHPRSKAQARALQAQARALQAQLAQLAQLPYLCSG